MISPSSGDSETVCTVDLAAMLGLAGKVAVVTGAAAGIGRGIAELLAGAGAHVVLFDRDEAQAQVVADAIGRTGASATAIGIDLADIAAVPAAFDEVARHHRRLDILVNNAAIFPMAPLDELSDAVWDKVIAVNLRAPMEAMRAAKRHMGEGGAIVNISSVDSIRASVPGLGHYAASKAGLNALTRAAAVEYAPLGIRVNAILPGSIVTEGTGIDPQRVAAREARWASRIPAGRLGRPDDVARAALFLCSPLAAYVHGHCLVVDGGQTIRG